MGGKKKSVANKLAKMSDEERARYTQRRAEIEEEARRRKEQLISTFMKNKIKKEDAFSRLNLAKINQHWHQILRKTKCKEMKDNVEHMKKWIDRIITLKNRTIEKLMEELEEAEDQYGHNLKYHVIFIDKIIDSQNVYLHKLRDDYDIELVEGLETSTGEQEELLRKFQEEQCHLKTVIYGQDVTTTKDLKKMLDYYNKKYDDFVCENRTVLEKLVKDREGICIALWRQIAEVVKQYVQRTDTRRAHLAELRRLDAESSQEIANNQERINREEQGIANLKDEYSSLKSRTEAQIKLLEKEIEDLSLLFLENKRKLSTELGKDEKRLRMLTAISNKAIKQTEDAKFKGEQIRMLIQACSKYESEKEKISKQLFQHSKVGVEIEDDVVETSEKLEESAKEDVVISTTPSEDTARKDISEKSDAQTGAILKQSEDIEEKDDPATKIRPGIMKKADSTETLVLRPKTAFMRRLQQRKSLQSAKTSSSVETLSATPDIEAPSTLKKVIITEKKQELPPSSAKTSRSSSPDCETHEGYLSKYFEGLQHMKNFWVTFSNVKLDCVALKTEKKDLLEQNKQLRGMMRAVLEAAALAKSIPDSRVSTRVASRTRTARSAPPRRLVL